MTDIKKNLIKLVQIDSSIEKLFYDVMMQDIQKRTNSKDYQENIELLKELFILEDKYLDAIDFNYIFSLDTSIRNDTIKYVVREYASNYTFSQNNEDNIDDNIIYQRIFCSLCSRFFDWIRTLSANNSLDDYLADYVKQKHIRKFLEKFKTQHPDMHIRSDSFDFDSSNNKVLVSGNSNNGGRGGVRFNFSFDDYFLNSQVNGLKDKIMDGMQKYYGRVDFMYLLILEMNKKIQELECDARYKAVTFSLIYRKYINLFLRYPLRNVLFNGKSYFRGDYLSQLPDMDKFSSVPFIPSVNDLKGVLQGVSSTMKYTDQVVMENYFSVLPQIYYNGCVLKSQLYLLSDLDILQKYVDILEESILSQSNDSNFTAQYFRDCMNECLNTFHEFKEQKRFIK